MKKYLKLRRKRDELGVVAIIAALLAVVLLMFAAYAVDIGMQVNRKHQLNDTLDAAAQAGAFELPGSSITAQGRGPGVRSRPRPDRDRDAGAQRGLLVRGRLQADERRPYQRPTPLRIPSTCYPGTGPYTAGCQLQDHRPQGQPAAR